MHFELSEERRLLADTAERFIVKRYPLARRHEAAAREEGFDRAMWSEFAELGLIGALLAPEVGGLGGEGEDLALVFEALGRGLVVEPFLASGVLGATPIALAGSKRQKALLQRVAAGELLLALAHGEPESRYAAAEIRTVAEQSGAGWRLSGRKAVVVNGDSADRLVVAARVWGAPDAEEGIGLFLLDADGAGVTRRGYGSVEGGRAAELRLEAAPAEPIGAPGEGFAALEETLARGALALSAEAVGVMGFLHATTLEYLKTRTQFGQPLGAFQALQHRMVDMLVEIEQARSATMLAASSLGADRVTRESNIAAAKHLAGRVGRLVAEETIQLHGGVAMTWEHHAPHYAKRLVMIDHLLGDQDHHLERFINLSAQPPAGSRPIG